MTTAYDPSFIAKFADQLYNQARWIVALYTIALGLLGLGGGLAGGAAMDPRDGAWPGAAIGFLLLGLMGLGLGTARAFALRLQAQQALCQLQIEQNTRRHGP